MVYIETFRFSVYFPEVIVSTMSFWYSCENSAQCDWALISNTT